MSESYLLIIKNELTEEQERECRVVAERVGVGLNYTGKVAGQTMTGWFYWTGLDELEERELTERLRGALRANDIVEGSWNNLIFNYSKSKPKPPPKEGARVSWSK